MKHEELHIKKLVYLWVPYNLTEHQKEEHVRISKETIKFLKDRGHGIISKILIGDETYILFFDAPTYQESKVWVYEDDPTPTMVKRQHAMKKGIVCYFLQKHRTNQSYQAGKTEDSHS
ncbi:uncharacterized protein LOC118179815 [Stegodyphus dumicola]|uniref:uncharacterized protein LOC118179815 n=1 Tax=Stegodyphus dumicola TaxID=202533 RepID=UPI0015AF9CBC|nr:uncharacterized protein LOC118179815 [Stegodyphus dumicola]